MDWTSPLPPPLSIYSTISTAQPITAAFHSRCIYVRLLPDFVYDHPSFEACETSIVFINKLFSPGFFILGSEVQSVLKFTQFLLTSGYYSIDVPLPTHLEQDQFYHIRLFSHGIGPWLVQILPTVAPTDLTTLRRIFSRATRLLAPHQLEPIPRDSFPLGYRLTTTLLDPTTFRDSVFEHHITAIAISLIDERHPQPKRISPPHLFRDCPTTPFSYEHTFETYNIYGCPAAYCIRLYPDDWSIPSHWPHKIALEQFILGLREGTKITKRAFG